jgi:hypothetical protein
MAETQDVVVSDNQVRLKRLHERELHESCCGKAGPESTSSVRRRNGYCWLLSQERGYIARVDNSEEGEQSSY